MSCHVKNRFLCYNGKGSSAQLVSSDSGRLKVGSARFLAVDGDSSLHDQAVARERGGETVVWVVTEDALEGFVALRDEPDPTATEALQQLGDEGVRAVMLSGDSLHTTEAIAAELGL